MDIWISFRACTSCPCPIEIVLHSATQEAHNNKMPVLPLSPSLLSSKKDLVFHGDNTGWTSKSVYAYACVCTCMCLCIHACVHTCMYACVYVCICDSMHVCVCLIWGHFISPYWFVYLFLASCTLVKLLPFDKALKFKSSHFQLLFFLFKLLWLFLSVYADDLISSWDPIRGKWCLNFN